MSIDEPDPRVERAAKDYSTDEQLDRTRRALRAMEMANKEYEALGEAPLLHDPFTALWFAADEAAGPDPELQAFEREVERLEKVAEAAGPALERLMYQRCPDCQLPDPERKGANCATCLDIAAPIIRALRAALSEQEGES
jgi:hypothetical protein